MQIAAVGAGSWPQALGKFRENVSVHAMRRVLDAIHSRRNRAVELRVVIRPHCVGVRGKARNAGAAVGLDSEFVEVFFGLCAHSQRTSCMAG
jgi:hypothetical protein